MSSADDKFKVLLCGEAAVGKTSVIKEFVKQAFEDKYKLTVGVDIFAKDVTADNGQKGILSIWDIGGQQRFEFIRTTFYRGAAGVLLVFDLTRQETFKTIDSWVDEIKKFCGDPAIVLLGNKVDLLPTSPEKVDAQAIQNYITAKNMAYFETSAKTGQNVNEAFKKLTNMVFSRVK